MSIPIHIFRAHIFGCVSNATFDASWICAMDGVTDDAMNINEMIAVCINIFFPRGTYRLISSYNQEDFHIGINHDDVSLTGEEGTVFLTKERLGMVCIFSKPYDIENSIRIPQHVFAGNIVNRVCFLLLRLIGIGVVISAQHIVH